MTDTIYALASGAGRAGIAVIRLSGPAAREALAALTPGKPLPGPRMASRRWLVDPATGEKLDDGVVLLFPGPASYTGEDVVELQIHGGAASIAAVTAVLALLPGCRPAGPGEFTRRAVLAGRMDLTEAEGLIDLIEAESEAQRRQALRQAGGALGQLYDGWRAQLIRALALIEASIDFVEEEDIPADIASTARPILDRLEAEMAAHLADGARGERLRRGLEIAIIGPPNAGKSSLLNALAQREAAIVSDIPGTTRDVVEARLVLAGVPVTLADTAGLRETADRIEAEGVRRALARAEEADLTLLVLDGTAPLPDGVLARLPARRVVLRSKADLPQAGWSWPVPGEEIIPLSLRAGDGLESLKGRLRADVLHLAGVGDAPGITRARHRDAVSSALAAIRAAARTGLPELAAEELRQAARALGRVTGRVDVEDLLDVIFREFCVGK